MTHISLNWKIFFKKTKILKRLMKRTVRTVWKHLLWTLYGVFGLRLLDHGVSEGDWKFSRPAFGLAFVLQMLIGNHGYSESRKGWAHARLASQAILVYHDSKLPVSSFKLSFEHSWAHSVEIKQDKSLTSGIVDLCGNLRSVAFTTGNQVSRSSNIESQSYRLKEAGISD